MYGATSPEARSAALLLLRPGVRTTLLPVGCISREASPRHNEAPAPFFIGRRVGLLLQKAVLGNVELIVATGVACRLAC